MAKSPTGNGKGKKVAVVVGATSKWQADGANTLLRHGKTVDPADTPAFGAAIALCIAVIRMFSPERSRASSRRPGGRASCPKWH